MESVTMVTEFTCPAFVRSFSSTSAENWSVFLLQNRTALDSGPTQSEWYPFNRTNRDKWTVSFSARLLEHGMNGRKQNHQHIRLTQRHRKAPRPPREAETETVLHTQRMSLHNGVFMFKCNIHNCPLFVQLLLLSACWCSAVCRGRASSSSDSCYHRLRLMQHLHPAEIHFLSASKYTSQVSQ
ncbi:hypothetical protein AMECASPLE_034870 [Ameca splendens]|uniref:Uncharacterized protein n=1 Tax=Ameca splendens TaxID=208324 RepID=A0ABV0XK99_9TELE